MEGIKLNEEDVRQHLNMQQDIINRMAANSSNCKTWLVTIVAALTALQISQAAVHNYGIVMVVVTIMFWCLDAYYLMLERLHREQETIFVAAVKKKDTDEVKSLLYSFSIKPGCKLDLLLEALISWSCAPLYITFGFITAFITWNEWFQSILASL